MQYTANIPDPRMVHTEEELNADFQWALQQHMLTAGPERAAQLLLHGPTTEK